MCFSKYPQILSHPLNIYHPDQFEKKKQKKMLSLCHRNKLKITIFVPCGIILYGEIISQPPCTIYPNN